MTAIRLLAAIAVSAVSVTSVWSSAATAAPTTPAAAAERLAGPVRAATAGKIAPITGARSADVAFAATVAGKDISMATAPNSPVVVKAAGGQLRLHLPGSSSDRATQANDGTVVRAGKDTSTAVQVLPDGGVRALVTLNNDQAPKAYDFTLDLPEGLSLRPGPDGGVDITSADGAMLAGEIRAPWAKDATGRALPTRYELRGNTVIQHIDTRGAAFPVVADPDVVYNCGWTTCNWTFSRWYTREVLKPTVTSTGGSVTGILSGSVLCGKIPHAVAAAACAVTVGISLYAVTAAIIKAVAQNQCFTVRMPHVFVGSLSVGVNSDGNCRNS